MIKTIGFFATALALLVFCWWMTRPTPPPVKEAPPPRCGLILFSDSAKWTVDRDFWIRQCRLLHGEVEVRGKYGDYQIICRERD